MTDLHFATAFQSNSGDVLIKCYCHDKNLHRICKSYNKRSRYLIGYFIPKYKMAKAMIGIMILIFISWYQPLIFEQQSKFWWKHMLDMNKVFAYPYKWLWFPNILTTVQSYFSAKEMYLSFILLIIQEQQSHHFNYFANIGAFNVEQTKVWPKPYIWH